MLWVECATRCSSACAGFGVCFLGRDIGEQIEGILRCAELLL